MRVKNAGFPFSPSTVTDALLLHLGEKAAFAFDAVTRAGDGRYEPYGLAVFRCPAVLQIRCGHPNDEARPGHVFYEAGFDGTEIVEIEESPWLREVMAVNAVRFPDPTRMFSGVRHHIFPFKETTLEILWRDFDHALTRQPVSEVAAELVPWVLAP